MNQTLVHRPRFRVICYLGPAQDLYHFSRVHTGLCALERAGEIELEFAPPPAAKPHYSAVGWAMLLVNPAGGPVRRVAIDLMDRSVEFSLPLLAESDVYCKRSYYPPHCTSLPAEDQGKVVPAGLNYACRSSAQTRRVLAAVGAAWTWRALQEAATGVSPLRKQVERLRQFQVIPHATDFEWFPDQPVRRRILFQTRLWDPAGVEHEDGDAINRERAELLAALRQAFPDEFAGGLVPEPYARKHYPDLLATESYRHHEFIAFSREIEIGIYTRGLHESDAFKLAEYLASSKCIVMTPPRNTLPAPLVEGRNYLSYGSIAECVEQCRRLLQDRELAASMRRANWEYYQRHVEPAAFVRRLLELGAAGG